MNWYNFNLGEFMNWDLIKEKYPKAYQLWRKWGYYFNTQDKGRVRRLYDFFDEQGIIIEISLSYFGDNNWYEYNIDLLKDRDAYIGSVDEPDYEEPYKTKTRTEAEEQAFLKAFEILESKL